MSAEKSVKEKVLDIERATGASTENPRNAVFREMFRNLKKDKVCGKGWYVLMFAMVILLSILTSICYVGYIYKEAVRGKPPVNATIDIRYDDECKELARGRLIKVSSHFIFLIAKS